VAYGRLNSLLLRWQGRLDSEAADRFAPWIVAAVLFVLLAAMSLAQARSLHGSTDLVAYTQASWLIRNGHEPLTTVTNGTNVYAQQGAFAFYPIAQLTALIPAIPLLLTVQALALSMTVLPLWRVCRRLARLRPGSSLVVLVVFAVYPIVHTLNLDGFHPESVALPFLLGAGYFGLSQHWRRFALCAVVAVLFRADLGLAIAGLGVLLMVQGFRRRGAITAILGTAWTVGFLVWAQPHIGHAGVSQLAAYSAYGHSVAGVAWGLISHAGTTFSNVLSQSNFRLLVFLFAPVMFLPFLAPRYLLPVVPLELAYLAGNVSQATRYGPQAVAITAFVFLATPMGLARLGRMSTSVSTSRVTVDRRVLITLLVACISFYILIAPSTPYAHPWGWGDRDAVDLARLAARDSISRDASVRASSSMLIVLAQRRELYAMHGNAANWGQEGAAAVEHDVDVVIIDRHELSSSLLDEAELEEQLLADGWVKRSDELDIVVFQRGS
jgi:uncharacterized membrane protein